MYLELNVDNNVSYGGAYKNKKYLQLKSGTVVRLKTSVATLAFWNFDCVIQNNLS